MIPEDISTTSIDVNGLAKRFNREWIFRKLNFVFQPGRTYAITGPNGSGKSTLLQVLWGQSPPSAGSIHYRENSTLIPVEEIYRKVAIATPYMDLIEEFTLDEQIAFHFRMKPMRKGLSTESIREKIGLRESGHKQIVNFSSGMRQRVKLGLAFSTQADLLFLDEPGTNLDKKAFQWYCDQLSELQQRTLIFIASNDPAEYETADQIVNILDFK